MKKAEKYVPRYAKARAEGGQRGRDAFYIFLCYFTGLVTGFEFGGYQYIFLDIRMEFGFSNTMMATVNVVQTVVSLCVSLVLSALLDRLKGEYGYDELDAFLFFFYILAKVWQARKKG